MRGRALCCINQLDQSAGECLDSNQGTGLEERVDQVRDPPLLNLQQGEDFLFPCLQFYM